MGDELSYFGVYKSWYMVQGSELGGIRVNKCG